jgi:mono/diheme cytochrome c family protein
VWAEEDGRLALVYRASAGKVHGLAASGARVWIAEGDALAAVEGGRVVAVQSAAVGAGARLYGSPSGDVWVLDGGALARYSLGAKAPAASDEATWAEAVRPVYLKSCASCHKPGGLSGVDLSSFAAWRDRGSIVKKRVIADRSMPPPRAAPLADADREALARWLAR